MFRASVLAAAFVVVGSTGWPAGPAAAQSPTTHQHSFSGAEEWAYVLDDPKRDAWQKPHEVIHALALKPDAVIADIGSGTGYFAMRFANMVPKGRVYGVDIEPDMVKYLAERAKREKRENVVAVAGAPDDPCLPEKADLILMVECSTTSRTASATCASRAVISSRAAASRSSTSGSMRRKVRRRPRASRLSA